jgi:hypothetical protein
MAVHVEFYHGLWQYMAVHGTTFCCLSLFMAVTRQYMAVQGLDLRRGGGGSPGRFSCAFESAALPTLSVATASGHCKHKLVYSCFSLGLFGTPPLPWARLCHQRPASSPPPPRVQPRQQPSQPRASSAPSAGGLGGLVVMNGVGRCTVTESMTRLKR